MYKPHETVLKTEHYSLQHYLPIGELTDLTPTYVQPPYAGRGHEVTDNLVRTCQEVGRHVYRFILHSAIPWFGKPFSIEDFVGAIDFCQAYIRDKHNVDQVDVVATCQGGCVTTIHNAQNPHLYRRHSLSATPINLKTGLGGVIEDYCETASMAYHRWLFAISGNVQPGIMQWIPFAMMNPYEAFVNRWHKLGNTILGGDQEKIQQKIDQNIWHDNIKNLGEWYLFTMEHHFIGNHLYDGTMVVGGKPVKLEHITCPVHVSVGGGDDITLPEQARAILDKVSSEEKHYKCFDKNHGHTAPFTWEEPLRHFAAEFYG